MPDEWPRNALSDHELDYDGNPLCYPDPMPTESPHPCSYGGCTELVTGRHCEHHARQHERDRGNATDRGYGASHRRWRKLVLAADPICHWPIDAETGQHLTGNIPAGSRRCLAPATVADHVKPLSLYPALALEPTNGQGLCTAAHRAKGIEERQAVYRRTW